DPAVYEFLRYDFRQLEDRYGSVVGTTFRTFPSYPQRYAEALSPQPQLAVDDDLALERLHVRQLPTQYTEHDLHARRFTARAARRLSRTVVPATPEHHQAA
ncbi:MAG TPA: hypothetical protein VND92_10315, partial [Vicinamibacterales bacterium]|nr:hypothetical protein [Vicinamibacterales bacterium]